MNEQQKRLFTVAFGVVNKALENSRKLQRLQDEEEEEFVLVLSQCSTV